MKFRLAIVFLIALTASICNATTKCDHQIRVAVIDTGLDLEDPRFKFHLCDDGHKNFVSTETMADQLGHGTHVTGLIEEYAKDSNYCLLIYKFYEEQAHGSTTMNRLVLAMQEAVQNGADIVNLSLSGPSFNQDERDVIVNNPQINFVAAAGNDDRNLDIRGNETYPASYFLPNEAVIANKDQNNKKAERSNWGRRVKWEIGEHVLSTLPCSYRSIDGDVVCKGYMSGTSQAAAIYSGKLVDKLSRSCDSR